MVLSTMDPAVLRAFRSGEYRDLARRAMAQGWDVYVRTGGHVSAVNPETGAQVLLSETAYASAHALANKRQEFARAGLDLRSKVDRRRAHRQEVRMASAAPTIQPSQGLHATRPGAQRAGGKFARVGEVEVHTISGQEVRVWTRTDGNWVAETRDSRTARGLRSWYAPSRDAVLAKVAEGIDTPPVPRPGARKAEPEAVAPVEEVAQEEATLAPAPQPDALAAWEQNVSPPLPVPDPDVVRDNAPTWDELSGHTFRVVQADEGEFPLVAALDTLDGALAPALAALEAAGKGDAAALLRSELERTPLEEEALSLYRRVMRGG